jgi:hypothetical protein
MTPDEYRSRVLALFKRRLPEPFPGHRPADDPRIGFADRPETPASLTQRAAMFARLQRDVEIARIAFGGEG